jgi:hypothetical protein
MTTNEPQIINAESAVKRELDRLELIERVPALRREAVQLAGNGFELILKLPHHPAVSVYANELAAMPRPRADLKVARRNLKAARINYEKRVGFRLRRDIREWSDGGAFVSLSAILEDRAEALHWRKVIKELEYVARIKRHNERQIERARPEFVTIGGELYPVSK